MVNILIFLKSSPWTGMNHNIGMYKQRVIAESVTIVNTEIEIKQDYYEIKCKLQKQS